MTGWLRDAIDPLAILLMAVALLIIAVRGLHIYIRRRNGDP